MRKPSKIIVYERTREVYKFMTSVSKQTKEIVRFFSEKWTSEGYFEGTSENGKYRTIENYIRRVKQTYYNFEKDVEIEKGRTLARLDDLYEKNIKIQDYKGALQVLKEIKELLGLDKDKSVNNTHTFYIDPIEWIDKKDSKEG